MGKPTGFMEYQRLSEAYEPVDKRLKNYKEFGVRLGDGQASLMGQGAVVPDAAKAPFGTGAMLDVCTPGDRPKGKTSAASCRKWPSSSTPGRIRRKNSSKPWPRPRTTRSSAQNRA